MGSYGIHCLKGTIWPEICTLTTMPVPSSKWYMPVAEHQLVRIEWLASAKLAKDMIGQLVDRHLIRTLAGTSCTVRAETRRPGRTGPAVCRQ